MDIDTNTDKFAVCLNKSVFSFFSTFTIQQTKFETCSQDIFNLHPEPHVNGEQSGWSSLFFELHSSLGALLK